VSKVAKRQARPRRALPAGRSVVIRLRVSPEELDQLRRRALADGLDRCEDDRPGVSELIRAALVAYGCPVAVRRPHGRQSVATS
jgi:hypothetical protein